MKRVAGQRLIFLGELFFFFFFFLFFFSVVLFLCWCGSGRGTSRTTSPKPLLVLWENATDHELLSVGGFTEKEGLNENNLNFHHSKDFVFYFSEFGTSRTVKKKKKQTMDSKH